MHISFPLDKEIIGDDAVLLVDSLGTDDVGITPQAILRRTPIACFIPDVYISFLFEKRHPLNLYCFPYRFFMGNVLAGADKNSIGSYNANKSHGIAFESPMEMVQFLQEYHPNTKISRKLRKIATSS